MKGYIRQKYKVNISQRRISTALQMAAPQYHQRLQTNMARLTNPIPYKADYFRPKLHVDQNEKLVVHELLMSQRSMIFHNPCTQSAISCF